MRVEEVTFSVSLDELSVEQLVQLSQGLGRKIEELREQRQYLRAKIDERLRELRSVTVPSAGLSAVAHGVVVEASMKG